MSSEDAMGIFLLNVGVVRKAVFSFPSNQWFQSQTAAQD
ncbi:hypothetical protein AM1_5666 [Acaryochloris marina MBIC11017]|uniref:Uncharacterized protein n=1 Tax=Acaryochloris marina (strain MBIC 11017) TaxID=329726 RepID=B0CG60_ACAM1|nr:hypothetical protein AM1_5666 [Acaryochloris marina MBIC11017]